MPENQVPVKETPIGVDNYIGSFVRVWKKAKTAVVASGKMTAEQFGPDIPPKAASAISFAQYMIETGDKHIFNFNVGNVKHTKGDGFNFHVLGKVWEGVTPEQAAELIASGQAEPDHSADHAQAVAPLVPVIMLNRGDRQFRAFATLDEGMEAQIEILAKRFGKAWPSLLRGDVDGFANALKSMGYFTASAQAYANGMRPSFNRAMQSGAYDAAIVTLNTFVNPVGVPFVSHMGPVGKVVAGTAATGGILYALWKWWASR